MQLVILFFYLLCMIRVVFISRQVKAVVYLVLQNNSYFWELKKLKSQTRIQIKQPNP